MENCPNGGWSTEKELEKKMMEVVNRRKKIDEIPLLIKHSEFHARLWLITGIFIPMAFFLLLYLLSPNLNYMLQRLFKIGLEAIYIWVPPILINISFIHMYLRDKKYILNLKSQLSNLVKESKQPQS